MTMQIRCHDLSYLPYECTGTTTAYHVHGCSFLLRFPLSNVDYQDIPNTQVIMTGKGREDEETAPGNGNLGIPH